MLRIGDYRIDSELGAEETAVVYLGVHVVLPRHAVVKVMHALPRAATAAAPTAPISPISPIALIAGPERALVLRMLREACLLEALSHPGIPRVFECGVLPDRRPWAAFERIEGVSIASLIADAPMPVPEVAAMLRDASDLLAHAHARGVAHRRLTADAIVRATDRGPSVCVRHWAAARALDAEPRVAVDALDDVRALGAVVFRALTGAAPEDAVSTSERCPAAPSELAALVDQMLAADPASRPEADEVRDRARWLADTFEPRLSDRLRWRPPTGRTPGAVTGG